MSHFIKVVQTYATKNKLEKEILELISKHDGTLLDKTHLPTFVSDLRDQVQALNEKHARCTAKIITNWSDSENECYRVEGVIQVNAYKVLIQS